MSESFNFEYKSRSVLGLPLIHICFKNRLNGVPNMAKGFIAIGQSGIGVINISKSGFGLISISQFTTLGYYLTKVAFSCLVSGHKIVEPSLKMSPSPETRQ